MRLTYVLPCLFIAWSAAACDSKPGKPPTPTMDAAPASPATDQVGKKALRDESSGQAAY